MSVSVSVSVSVCVHVHVSISISISISMRYGILSCGEHLMCSKYGLSVSECIKCECMKCSVYEAGGAYGTSCTLSCDI